MDGMMMTRRFCTLVALIAVNALAQPGKRGLVLISIDGMRPDYLLEADKHKLKIPNLRDILKRGSHATGVRGVLPTVTYPSHTTMVTGVAPVKHGIVNNETLDPEGKNLQGWYWYTEDIRVPTLWDAASAAGYRVASVSWPVTAGARSIQHNIPEYWRAMEPEDLKLQRLLSTPGLLGEFEKKLGPYQIDLREAIPADWARTKYAVEIVRTKHARFVTLHLGALDHIAHDHGPLTPETFEALEEIDKMVGEVVAAMRAETADSAVCIVSDHGFSRVDHTLSLRAAFAEAGLITPNPRRLTQRQPAVTAWKAQTWESAGSAMVVLKDPADRGTRAAVEALLKKLAADPANGIEAILDKQQIAALGGAPNVEWLVDMKPNFLVDSAMTGPVAKTRAVGGAHGYSPTHRDMLASFFIAGAGVRQGATLGEIDMRSFAPTLAAYMGVKFPSADLPPLDVLARPAAKP